MTIAERIAQLEDQVGDASACSDWDCECKGGHGERMDELARLRREESLERQYKDAYGDDFAGLATWQAEGR